MLSDKQTLDRINAIVNDKGIPTDYFIRYIQSRNGAITDLDAAVTLLESLVAGKADKSIVLTAGTGLNGGGDLSANRTFNLSNTAVSPGSYTNTNLTVDATGRITAASNGGAVLLTYNVPFGFTSTPTASEIMLIHTFAEAVTFPDEWLGAKGSVGTNPGVSFVLTIAKNGSTVGTITVSTGGVSTFVTTGTTVLYSVGDVMKITAPVTPDASIANAAWTLIGTK